MVNFFVYFHFLFALLACLLLLGIFIFLFKQKIKWKSIAKEYIYVLTNTGKETQGLNRKFGELLYSLNPKPKDALVQLLIVYSAYDEAGPIKLYRHGRDYDGGYVVPEKAMREADVLLGYGIADDHSFEEQFCDKYGKPAFGFDCSIPEIKSQNKLFTFVNECIGNDKFVWGKSGGKISTFDQQLKRLRLTDKKLFIKMDIEGAEYEAFDSILPHSSMITGIALEIHYHDNNLLLFAQAIELLERLQQDFVLVHVHGTNHNFFNGFVSRYVIGFVPPALELSYINKRLLTHYHISENQAHPTPLDMPHTPNLPEVEFNILVDKKIAASQREHANPMPFPEKKPSEIL